MPSAQPVVVQLGPLWHLERNGHHACTARACRTPAVHLLGGASQASSFHQPRSGTAAGPAGRGQSLKVASAKEAPGRRAAGIPKVAEMGGVSSHTGTAAGKDPVDGRGYVPFLPAQNEGGRVKRAGSGSGDPPCPRWPTSCPREGHQQRAGHEPPSPLLPAAGPQRHVKTKVTSSANSPCRTWCLWHGGGGTGEPELGEDPPRPISPSTVLSVPHRSQAWDSLTVLLGQGADCWGGEVPPTPANVPEGLLPPVPPTHPPALRSFPSISLLPTLSGPSCAKGGEKARAPPPFQAQECLIYSGECSCSQKTRIVKFCATSATRNVCYIWAQNPNFSVLNMYFLMCIS